MVLGLSIGKKSRKGKDGGPVIRSSPSLPTLHSQGIPWPENLVDPSAVQAARQEPVSPIKTQSGFNKSSKATNGDSTGGTNSIAALYAKASGGISRTLSGLAGHGRTQQRKRVAPTLNIMVVGASGTGKTSLLKLFLDTSDFALSATLEQKASVEAFLNSSRKSTRAIQNVSVEIAETRYDRILLTLIDTPGLRFGVGEELALERSVASLVKYFDTQYDDTMGEESKVVRQSKGDQHVHLCIYLIDPNSVISSKARRNKRSPLTRTRSQTTSSHAHGDPESEVEYSEEEGGDESDVQLTMNPVELKVIKRLAARVNILPVIARSDELTESRLRAIKRTVKRELQSAALGFGVFTPVSAFSSSETQDSASMASRQGAGTAAEDEEEEEEERSSRPVIRIRSTKPSGERSRSRRRSRTLDESPVRAVDSDNDQPPLPDDAAHLHDNQQSHHAPRITKSVIDALLPFALVSPQPIRQHRKSVSKEDETLSPTSHVEDPGTPKSRRTSVPPSSFPGHLNNSTDYEAPREFPKGKFVRRYKWGTLDVCDPAHCDFIAMRTAILSTYFRALKTSTREVLYEKYRTDKLLARRATANISDKERKRLLQELGL